MEARKQKEEEAKQAAAGGRRRIPGPIGDLTAKLPPPVGRAGAQSFSTGELEVRRAQLQQEERTRTAAQCVAARGGVVLSQDPKWLRRGGSWHRLLRERPVLRPSSGENPEILVVTNMGFCQRPSEYPGIASPPEKIYRSICQNISRSKNDVTETRFSQVRF